MERIIREAAADVRQQWPEESTRRKFEADKKRALSQARTARDQNRKAGRKVKGISFWDFMPSQYPPPGYRSTGLTARSWRVELRLEAGPTLVAILFNDARKGGAPYAYMAKKPPPESNKSYFKTIAIPAIKARENRAVEALTDDMARLVGAN